MESLSLGRWVSGFITESKPSSDPSVERTQKLGATGFTLSTQCSENAITVLYIMIPKVDRA